MQCGSCPLSAPSFRFESCTVIRRRAQHGDTIYLYGRHTRRRHGRCWDWKQNGRRAQPADRANDEERGHAAVPIGRQWRPPRHGPSASLDENDTNRMMDLYSFTTVVIIASAIFFYRAAKFDGSSAVLWVVLSVGISLLLLTCFRVGMVRIILGQAGLFLGITFFRIIQKS
jgi:hypothetical protein